MGTPSPSEPRAPVEATDQQHDEEHGRVQEVLKEEVEEEKEDVEEEEEDEEEEEEELMFAFEPEGCNEHEQQLDAPMPAMFRSISDFHPLSRPSNPLAAVLQSEAKHESESESEDVSASFFRSFALHPFDFNGRRKRKAAEAPAVLMVTPVVRPVPKRARLDRSATAPPCFMRAPSPAGQPLSRSSSNEPGKESEDKCESSRPLSASIAIPAAAFRPIRPASSSLAGSNHSSTSSTKSWGGNFCRRSLDVSSPVRSRLSDLVISSSATRTASFDGS